MSAAVPESAPRFATLADAADFLADVATGEAEGAWTPIGDATLARVAPVAGFFVIEVAERPGADRARIAYVPGLF